MKRLWSLHISCEFTWPLGLLYGVWDVAQLFWKVPPKIDSSNKVSRSPRAFTVWKIVCFKNKIIRKKDYCFFFKYIFSLSSFSFIMEQNKVNNVGRKFQSLQFVSGWRAVEAWLGSFKADMLWKMLNRIWNCWGRKILFTLMSSSRLFRMQPFSLRGGREDKPEAQTGRGSR